MDYAYVKRFYGVAPIFGRRAMSQSIDAARRAWDAAVRAWSQCDHSDAMAAMKLGEAMMYAGTDLICAHEAMTARGRTLSDTLNAYGFPVSEAHWKNASGEMSVQARALHLAADGFRAALQSEGRS